MAKLYVLVNCSKNALLLTFADSPDLLDGFPMSLQLVGKHFQDEELIRAGEVIERAIRS